MIRGFYSAGSGIGANQAGINSISNNIANINTSGYKRQVLSFSDLVRSELNAADSGGQNVTVGNGVRVSGAATIMSLGNIRETGNAYDFALTGDGFFATMDNGGKISYTRDGSFYIAEGPGGTYLASSDGSYVLNADGRQILSASEDAVSQIGIFDFPNRQGLIPVGGNRFESSVLSGNAFAVEGEIRSGFLEASNVDLADEMVNLIEVQKAFQFNAKMVQTADEVENIINNLR